MFFLALRYVCVFQLCVYATPGNGYYTRMLTGEQIRNKGHVCSSLATTILYFHQESGQNVENIERNWFAFCRNNQP